jgi:hypothetical protein
LDAPGDLFALDLEAIPDALLPQLTSGDLASKLHDGPFTGGQDNINVLSVISD